MQRLARSRSVARVAGLLAAALLSRSAGAAGSDSSSTEDVHSTAPSLVVVVGAAGADEYERSFAQWAQRWSSAAEAAGTSVTLIGRDDEAGTSDRDRLQTVLSAELDVSEQPLWLVLIGHGTFDGRQSQFNLRGDDVSADELAGWLENCERPLAVINCASASAPFIDRLAGPGRIVVTATKSGAEENYSRFGEYLSQSIADLAADLDKDGQVSLLEAFLQASRQTQAYYDGQRLLATEHALLDDNGDARGVRADFFIGLRPTTQAEGGEAVDGLRAHQWHLVPSEEERQLPDHIRQRRNELELELARLRERKSDLDEDAYYELIEPVLLEIARLYASLDERASPTNENDVPAATNPETSLPEVDPAPSDGPGAGNDESAPPISR